MFKRKKEKFTEEETFNENTKYSVEDIDFEKHSKKDKKKKKDKILEEIENEIDSEIDTKKKYESKKLREYEQVLSNKSNKKDKVKKTKNKTTSMDDKKNNEDENLIKPKSKNERNPAIDMDKTQSQIDSDIINETEGTAMDDLDVQDLNTYINEIVEKLGFVKADLQKYSINNDGSNDLVSYYITKYKKQLYLHFVVEVKSTYFQTKPLYEQFQLTESFGQALREIPSDSEMELKFLSQSKKVDVDELLIRHQQDTDNAYESYSSINAKEKLADFYNQANYDMVQSLNEIYEDKYYIIGKNKIYLSIDDLKNEEIFEDKTKEFYRAFSHFVTNLRGVQLLKDVRMLELNEVFSLLVSTLTQQNVNFDITQRKTRVTEDLRYLDYTNITNEIFQLQTKLHEAIARDQEYLRNVSNISKEKREAIFDLIEKNKFALGIITPIVDMRTKIKNEDGTEEIISKSSIL